MGYHPFIDHNNFPAQHENVGKLVSVTFNYDTTRLIDGKIVREDLASPYVMIIQLVDGRYVLSTECQYSFP